MLLLGVCKTSRRLVHLGTLRTHGRVITPYVGVETLLIGHSGWAPGQFSELVLGTLFLVVHPCLEPEPWSDDSVAVVVGTT